MDARTLLDAMSLWEGTGTAVAQAAQAVSSLLAEHGIGNLVAGGLAVQLHGYPRTTIDVDIIVPNVQEAHAFLVANGYQASVRQPLGVIDRNRRVRIALGRGLLGIMTTTTTRGRFIQRASISTTLSPSRLPRVSMKKLIGPITAQRQSIWARRDLKSRPPGTLRIQLTSV